MTDFKLFLDRRTLLGGLGAALIAGPGPAHAQGRATLALEAVAGTVALAAGQPATPIWQLIGGPDAGPLRFRRGETIDVTLTNKLIVPVALNWSGLDGNSAAEPFTGQPLLAPNSSVTYQVTFRHAGTMLVDLIAAGDTDRPTSPRAIIVTEPDSPAVDRDEVLLFQEWRSKPDGGVIVPGRDPGDAMTMFTVNGKTSIDLKLAQNDRLRLRLINASQRTAIAIKISDHDVRILAIDGQPAEPFLARDGVVVLAPGSRVDAFVDITRQPGSVSAIALLDGREARPISTLVTSDAKPVRPTPLPAAGALPSNGLPAQLDLKSALRIDLPLGSADWRAATSLTPTTPPAFKAKRGRTVVLALANRGDKPVAFHLHGHHVRLLDRLDDGWKPFWLDTVAVATGQTQRIAFLAEYPGLYPMQAVATDWAAPRLMRSYLVE